MRAEFTLFVGIDWASKVHQACVIDADRKVVDERGFANSPDGITGLIDKLTELAGGQLERVAVAIEVPRGAIVEGLLERGAAVFSINPKQLDRFRDRHTVAGAKDDQRDAFVLADSLRTDEPCFRRLSIEAPDIIRLRELSRVDDELRELKFAQCNRLWHQIHRFFPSFLDLCPAADEPWLWAVLDAFLVQGRRPERRLVAAILKNHRIRRLNAETVFSAWTSPRLAVAPGTVESATLHIGILIKQLELIERQRRENDALIRKALEASKGQGGSDGTPSDTEILASMPGVGHLISAIILSEASTALSHRDYPALRSLSGVAPVTRRSGGKCVVTMRRACSDRLRNALYHWARVSMQRDSGCRQRYVALRARGLSHGRALRAMGDGLLKIFFAALKTRTLFDPNHLRQSPPMAGAAMA